MINRVNKFSCTFKNAKDESKYLNYIWGNSYEPLYNKYIPLIFIPLSIYGIIYSPTAYPNAFFYVYIIVGLSFNYLKSRMKRYIIICYTYYIGFIFSLEYLTKSPFNSPFDPQIVIFFVPILFLAFPNISFLPSFLLSLVNFLIGMHILLSSNYNFWNIYLPTYIFLSLVFIKWNNEFSNRVNFCRIIKS